MTDTTMPSSAAPEVFARQSSGLVRTVSTWDIVYYGVMAITVAYIIFDITAWPAYPGSSMELASFLTVIGSIAVAIVYGLFASIYPRSGGEYVFLTRTLHPSIGFVLSFVQTVWYTFYFGVNGAFFCIYGLAPMFGIAGLQAHSKALTDIGTWFASDVGIFIGGTVMVCLIGWMLYRGMGGYFRFQRWGTLVAMISVVATIIVLVLGATGAVSFSDQFNSLAGHGAYAQVTKGVHTPPYAFGSTLNYMIWPAFAILFSVNMVSFSGEVKNVRRGPLIGMIGAMLVSGALYLLLMFFGREALGDKFLLAAPGDAHFPLATSPFLQTMAGVLGGFWPLSIFLNFWIIFIIPYAQGSNIIYGSRALLAWSLDGMAPAKLSEVSPKRHSPAWAILVLTALAIVALAIYAFTSWLAILSGLLAFAITFLVVSLLGLAFPFWKRDVFEASPAPIRVAGIPLMALGAVVGIVFVGFLVYRSIVDDAYGANTTVSVWSVVGTFVVGAGWYVAARWLRARQGAAVERRFKEIPVE